MTYLEYTDYSDFSQSIWDQFCEEIEVEYDDIEQDDVKELDSYISEGWGLDESESKIIERMVKWWVGDNESGEPSLTDLLNKVMN
jgi:hypothetical protein